jgi:DNA-directed RNA polymerase specialized sigma24 family protein
MKSNAKVSPPVDNSARTQFTALIEQGVFRACERHVMNAYDAEERVQEGLGLTWKWYQQEIAKGHQPDLALVRHACNRRTVDRSHRLDSGDRRHWTSDVYAKQGRHGVELRRLQLVDLEDDRVEQDPNLGLAEAGCQDPTEKLDSALDLEAWLKQLSARDRTLLAMKQAGCGLEEIGRKLKTTSSTAWKHGQELGTELAERAGVKIEKQRRQRLPRGLPPAVRDAIAVE